MSKQPRFGDLVQRHAMEPHRLGVYLFGYDTWTVILLRREEDDVLWRWRPGDSFQCSADNWRVLDGPEDIDKR